MSVIFLIVPVVIRGGRFYARRLDRGIVSLAPAGGFRPGAAVCLYREIRDHVRDLLLVVDDDAMIAAQLLPERLDRITFSGIKKYFR